MSAVDSLPCGVLSFRDDGTILEANAELARWLGRSADELAGQKFETILSVPSRIFLQTHLFPILAMQGNAEEIFLTLHGPGGNTPVMASLQRHAQAGDPITHCAFLTVRGRRRYEDEILEARRKAEEAVRTNSALNAAKEELEKRSHELEHHLRATRRRNEELERVNEILSHDLREPVRKIRMFAEIARLPAHAENPDADKALKKIESLAAHADALAVAMRTYLGLEAERSVVDVDLRAAAQQAADEVAASLAFSDWDLQIDALPTVEGDRALLEMLFFHLLHNTVKFRDSERKLQVRITGDVRQENVFQALKDRYQYADYAEVRIVDNGRGFDPKYRSYVFSLLNKADLASSGLGVGLAFCRKIAVLHGGDIDAETAPGRGATFKVLLPLRQ